MKSILPLVAALFCLAASAATIPLEVHRHNGMAFVQGEIESRPCRFLFDTGTTITTLDLDFATNTLGKTSLGKPQIAPGSNVSQVPDIIPVSGLKIGQAQFDREYVAAIDLSQVCAGMNERFDGVLGMDVISAAPSLVSFRNSAWVLNAAPDGFPNPKKSLAPDALVFPAMKCGKVFPVLVDSGSSITFMNSGLWPVDETLAAGERQMTGANGAETRLAQTGQKGAFDKGPALELSPLVMDGRESTVGSDTLQRYDLFMAPAPLRFSFRPAR